MEFQSKLVPVLRESIDVVKMILFKELKRHTAEKYPDKSAAWTGKLSGAILNDLFGAPNTQEPFLTFVQENGERIEAEMKNISTRFEALQIPLTDALRVQFLCDSQEGVDSEFVLSRARELGILIEDREIPLPNTFMNMVRKIGVAHEILAPRESDEGLE
ncbi:MAG: hypothetical protein GY859_02975 [Desulfobacterales bacterium]|nr:hypothetical protein [Desulfobacterales bacterium]